MARSIREATIVCVAWLKVSLTDAASPFTGGWSLAALAMAVGVLCATSEPAFVALHPVLAVSVVAAIPLLLLAPNALSAERWRVLGKLHTGDPPTPRTIFCGTVAGLVVLCCLFAVVFAVAALASLLVTGHVAMVRPSGPSVVIASLWVALLSSVVAGSTIGKESVDATRGAVVRAVLALHFLLLVSATVIALAALSVQDSRSRVSGLLRDAFADPFSPLAVLAVSVLLCAVALSLQRGARRLGVLG